MAAIESAAAAAAAAAVAAAAAAPTSAEDAAKKKNTDCVYFLASPLTCKKGGECEFRHSEAARINPRDCWYWLSGECWNRECPFRHPPVDARPQQAPVQPVSTKARPLCYYYAQGYCAKGERCSFMHPGTPVHKPVPVVHLEQKQQPAAEVKPAEMKTAEPTTLKQPLKQQAVPPAEVSKAAQITATRKSEPVAPQIIARKPEAAQVAAAPKQTLQARKPSPAVVVENRNLSPEPQSSTHEEDEEEDEVRAGTNFSRSENGDGGYREENSPGFDVLVDDGPEEQLHYGEDGEFLNHEDAGGRYDNEMDHDPYDFEYNEMYRQGGRFDSPAAPYDHPRGFGGFDDRQVVGEYERGKHEDFDRIDYDRPRYVQFDNLEREYYKKSTSIKDRLVFNGGGENRPAFLDRNDLRNLLEKRRVDTRFQRELRHRDDNREHQLQQQRRFVHRLGGRRSQERVFTSRSASRVEQRRGALRDPSPPPVAQQYEMNRGAVRPRAFESSEFAAPKSLAQIRAEKRKLDRGEGNGFAKRVHREGTTTTTTTATATAQDDDKFEGPKPLREILKDKQKVAVVDERRSENQAGLMRVNGFSSEVVVEEGGNPMIETQENGDDLIDDDEDDDDFAKKLGGFFT